MNMHVQPSPARPDICRLLTAAKVFGVSSATLYRWIRQGHITKITSGSMTFVRVSEVEKHITGDRH